MNRQGSTSSPTPLAGNPIKKPADALTRNDTDLTRSLPQLAPSPPVVEGGAVFSMSAARDEVRMNQLETYERNSPVSDIAPWEKEEYAPYDVVWGCIVGIHPGYEPVTYSVWPTYEAAMACPLEWFEEGPLEPYPVTLHTAKARAVELRRIAVVLRDHDGNEIRRWSV